MGFVSAIFFVAWLPLPNRLLAEFELRYSTPSSNINNYVGIGVLGGSAHPIYAGMTQRGIEPFRVTDRMVSAAQLVRDYPRFKVLYTNGSLEWNQPTGGAQSLSSQTAHFFPFVGHRCKQLVV